MTDRPHVLLSTATSIDGYIDDASARRLLLSNQQDLDRVDQVRAESDAILVGGNTIRRDNPRLLVTSDRRRAARVAAGHPEHPLKVTVTASGDLDPDARFWGSGGAKLVYTRDAAYVGLRRSLAGRAEVVSLGENVEFPRMLDDLARRGVRRLMVEGGSQVHTQFLAQSLADEIHLAIAPVLVGQAKAPRFLLPAEYPGGTSGRMALLEARTILDVVLLRYAPQEIAW